MPDQPADAPKIIVDADWKSQAQAEKERLAEEEAKRTPPTAPGGQAERGELPPADFSALVGILVTQALMYLGGIADRKTGAAIFDPDMARFYIDLLATLERRTKGNLTDAETRDLEGAIHELRLRFVELTQAVARQAAAGQAQTPAGPAGPTMHRVG